ncbi:MULTISPECIES: hypothetical protein [unclassified Caballeronia]|jgi:hypothetical protein|uniref:hypothetical protein n=1 Tax=unclassified Caballeronia TaxID=2646786 RepID=UPI002027C5B8|nr:MULTISPECIES: hypothetical protein [unclassified Caballeronia]MDR5798354.1 hypothetical protein [Caballeronia sp. LZ008]
MKSAEHVYEAQDSLLVEFADTETTDVSPEALAAMVAEAMRVKRCVVSIPVDDRVVELCAARTEAFGEVHIGEKTAIVEYSDARDKMFAVLALNGKTIGVVQVSGPRLGRQFDEHDLKLLRILGTFVTRSVEADRLEKLVASPFAQATIKRSSDQTIGDIVAQSVQNPSQLSKMLARSFYREMTRAGFDFGQIIGAATEIISELASNVRKHTDRKQRRAG